MSPLNLMKFIRLFLSRHKLKTALVIFTGIFTIIFIGFFIPLSITFLYLDHKYPLALPDKNEDFAVTVAAYDKTPLRSFPDKKGVWRYPVKITEVSPLYIEALIHYEDRWFFHHPGINPWALLRAVFQYAKYRRAISGGSTLTMQVARILHPHAKTIPGKSIQMFRALQLEYHLTKNEILTLYLNYAPFGGTVEGVQTASFAYLGKPAIELSRAEAALLTVLPQAPSRLRPDRHGMRARKARDKVLNRMAKLKVWSEEVVEDAKMEAVDCTFNQRSVLAPLLARRLKINMKASKNRSGVIHTLIDINRQQTVANIIRDFIHTTPKRTSAAALLVENKTLAVKAYVGSGDFFDNERFGHVDMIRAYRSPGSTLKPFLYAFAIEEGLIHSESLLVDAPFSFSGYRPGNFTRNFSGPVSVSEALRRSLNIPAVDLLDRICPMFFDSRLRQGGFKLKFAPHVKPNLSMILGGVGTNLEDLVSAFAAFGRNGLSGKLRYTPETSISERRMMDPGAAYIIRRILKDMHRPDLPGGRLSLDRSRQVAWKTGTSYGARDAWTIGVTDDYTIGIWVG
ncbi:penicillin-binding protein 1C, partial [Desulfobacterales bacterium HSG16]|nr:penicillin-binding protein 1C [Desulfobacterales bacterium HSG16]